MCRWDPEGLPLLEAVFAHFLQGKGDRAAVSCLEIYDEGEREWKDVSLQLLSRLSEAGFRVAPASECALNPYEQARAGSGWTHVPSGRSAEQYRVKVVETYADSADFAFHETFSVHAQVCRYRARRMGSQWEFTLQESPCAVGDRSRGGASAPSRPILSSRFNRDRATLLRIVPG